MAQIVRMHRYGGPEVLELKDEPVRAPGTGEVRIRVHAIGLNRSDTNVRRGSYVLRPLPASLGFEAAGVIDALGEGVSGMRDGDAVSIIPLGAADYTTYGELIIVPARQVVPIPHPLDAIGAAALWGAYLTAYGPLIADAGIAAGDHVAITAASSSVGLAAIQIVRAVGAVPIALTRRRSKVAALMAAGAAHVVVTGEDDIAAGLATSTGGAGPRVVLDLAAGPTIGTLCSVTAPGGIVLLCGVLDPSPVLLPVLTAMVRRLTLKGCVLDETVQSSATLAAARGFIEGELAAGRIRPTVARTFRLDQIVAAHEYLESNEQVGKIVVTTKALLQDRP